MCDLWGIGVASLAGVAAGLASRLAGGAGVQWTTLKMIRTLAETVDDLQDRVTREVKRRASEVSVQKRSNDDLVAELLLERGRRDSVPPHDDRATVRARARQQGLM
jgi:hypothetical protein